jgi:transposase
MGGRPRVPDRAVLTGNIFVLKSGIPWEMLPKEMGCGSGTTCWRRLKEWQEAGVWRCLPQVLLDRLGKAERIVFSTSATISERRGSRGAHVSRLFLMREARRGPGPTYGTPCGRSRG